jgi:hypothetical protein
MAKSAIDLNRGVITSRHRALDLYIHMYADDPGVYLDDHGNPIPSALAEEVGFDVKKFAKLKKKRDSLREFEAQMNDQLELEADEVLAEGEGYKVVSVSEDAANVYDDDGNRLNNNVLPKQAAMLLFNKLTAGKKQDKVNEVLTKKAEAKVEAVETVAKG